MLPFGPLIDDHDASVARQGVCAAINANRLVSTAAWTAGERTTPPSPTSSLCASNCGLTRTTASAAGVVTFAIGPSSKRSEMNEASLAAKSGTGENSSGVSRRAFVRSMTTTRGSPRKLQSSRP